MSFEAREIVEVQHVSRLPGLRDTINLTVPSRSEMATLAERFDPPSTGKVALALKGPFSRLLTEEVDRLEAAAAGCAPAHGVGGRARSPGVAQRAAGVTLAAIAGLRRRFGLQDLEPERRRR